MPSPFFSDLKEKVILFPNVEPGDTLHSYVEKIGEMTTKISAAPGFENAEQPALAKA